MFGVLQAPGERGEGLARPEQARIEKIENRPQIREPVFHRRAGQRETHACIERLGRARLLGAGILDRLRFVEHGKAPARGRDPGQTLERPVAGDHQIHVRQPPGIDVRQFGGRHCRWMRNDCLQARHEALDLRRPVGEQRRRRHQQARSPSVLGRLTLQHHEQREHLNGLAQTHIVGETAAKTEAGQEVEPAHARLLIGPQRGLQCVAGLHAREPFLAAQRFQRFGQPGAGHHPRPVAVGLDRRTVSQCICAGHEAHRLAKGKPALGGGLFDAAEMFEHAAELAAVNLHPVPADELEPVGAGEQLLDFGRGEPLALQCHFHFEIEQRLLAKQRGRPATHARLHLRAWRAARLPGTGSANDDAGRFQPRHIGEKLECFARRHAQRVIDAALVHHLAQPGALFRGALHGHEQRQEPCVLFSARVLAQSLRKRHVLRPGVCRQARGVRRQEGERRLGIIAVFGKVEVHPPHQVPCRVAALEEVLDR